MARFAPVAPPQILKLLGDTSPELLGDYHLFLAHDIVEQEAAYAEIRKAYWSPEWYIIMDNSLIELGHPVDLDVMRRACEIFPPNVIVLPDYLADFAGTIQASTRAYREWSNAGLGPFLGVIQGRTLDEMKRCAEHLLVLPQVRALGIPRVVTKTIGSRRAITKYVVERKQQLHRRGRDIDIHLLGFSDNIRDDIECARIHEVGGIDSAVPIRLGFHHIKFNLDLDWHPPRGDYWKFKGPLPEETIHNLDAVRQWLQA